MTEERKLRRIVHFVEQNYKFLMFIYVPIFIGAVVINLVKAAFGVFGEPVDIYGAKFLNGTAFVLTAIVIYTLGNQIIQRNKKINRIGLALSHLDAIALYAADLSVKVGGKDANDDMVAKATYKFFRRATNQLSRFFTEYVGAYCHATVKLYDPKSGLVKTLQRDDGASCRREEIDEALPNFHYTRNTAFKEILNDKKTRVYINNDLPNTAGYENRHDNWREYYGSVAVVPITLARGTDHVTPENVIGFICIDNKCGGFDHSITSNVLSTVACAYFAALIRLNQCKTEAKGISIGAGG